MLIGINSTLTMKRMSKQYIIEILLSLQNGFVFCFSVLGGVLANEAYLIIKNPNHKKWNNILYKIILALFVCYISSLYYAYKGYDVRFHNGFIALCGFLHYQIGNYIIRDLFPMLGNTISQLITKGKK